MKYEELEEVIQKQETEIERLQSKIAEYERKLADGDLVSKEWHDEQIGVLNCEIEEYKAQIEDYKRVNKLLEMDIKDLHAEREKRVEEVYADFMKDYNIMRDELNACCDENAELQKQAERLKIDLENEKNWGKIQTKQAVKDTAKEILEDFDKHGVYSKDYTDFMRKEYGVEVE